MLRTTDLRRGFEKWWMKNTLDLSDLLNPKRPRDLLDEIRFFFPGEPY